MKITEFNSPSLKMLRAELDTALKVISDKYDIDLSLGTMSYDSSKSTTRLTLQTRSTVTTASGIEVKAKGVEFLKLYDLPDDAFTKEFTIQGTRFRLVGLNPRRPKNSCSIERVSDSRGFKCTEDVVRRALELVK